MPKNIIADKSTEQSQRILKSVRDMISDVGYHGLTMRALAIRSNVALQTLYNLYNNKDELVHEAILDLLQQRSDAASRKIPEPGYERILEVADQMARQIELTPKYAEAITVALLQAVPGDPLLQPLIRDIYIRNRQSLTNMNRNRQLKPGTNIKEVALLLAAANWASILIWQKGFVPLSKLRKMIRNQLLSVLIPVTRGAAQKKLQNRLDEPLAK